LINYVSKHELKEHICTFCPDLLTCAFGLGSLEIWG